MDPALKEAAINGDVEFLKKAFSKEPLEYFLTQTPKGEDNAISGNIFHLAAYNKRVEFIREAMILLPKDIQKELLFQLDDNFRYIPLHAAAYESTLNLSYDIVLLMKQMYASFSLLYDDEDGPVKPWLALTPKGATSLHLAFIFVNKNNEKCAMEILAMDTDFASCTIVDSFGNTPLHYALKNGFNIAAENILMSPLSSSSIFASTEVLTPFTCSASCSEQVCLPRKLR